MVGDSITLNFQLFDQQQGIRFVPPSTAIVKVTFNNQDGTTLVKTGTFIDALDQSLISVDLLSADTAQLLGGNLTFTVDLLGDGTEIINGVIFGALQQIIICIPIT